MRPHSIPTSGELSLSPACTRQGLSALSHCFLASNAPAADRVESLGPGELAAGTSAVSRSTIASSRATVALGGLFLAGGIGPGLGPAAVIVGDRILLNVSAPYCKSIIVSDLAAGMTRESWRGVRSSWQSRSSSAKRGPAGSSGTRPIRSARAISGRVGKVGKVGKVGQVGKVGRGAARRGEPARGRPGARVGGARAGQASSVRAYVVTAWFGSGAG
jgi:hypothetical protein